MDDTAITPKPDRENPEGHSHLFRISVRGWLAIALILTVCLHSVAAVGLALILKQPELLKVTEPLYTMSGMVLAFYFGQQTSKTKAQ